MVQITKYKIFLINEDESAESLGGLGALIR